MFSKYLFWKKVIIYPAKYNWKHESWKKKISRKFWLITSDFSLGCPRPAMRPKTTGSLARNAGKPETCAMTKEDILILGNIKWLQYCPFGHLDPIWCLMAVTVNQSSRADIFLQNTHHGSVLCGLSLDMNHPLESKCPLTLESLLWQQSWNLGLWFWMNSRAQGQRSSTKEMKFAGKDLESELFFWCMWRTMVTSVPCQDSI